MCCSLRKVEKKNINYSDYKWFYYISVIQNITAMKKQIMRLIALLIFASVAISSCSIEYREHHRRHWDDHDHDHDRDDHDHDYRNY